VGATQYRRPNGDHRLSLSHVHPEIKRAMKDYHEKSMGRVAVQKLLEAANITFKDRPYLTNLVDATEKTGCVTTTALAYANTAEVASSNAKVGTSTGKISRHSLQRSCVPKYPRASALLRGWCPLHELLQIKAMHLW
jgi:hypothetical protein